MSRANQSRASTLRRAQLRARGPALALADTDRRALLRRTSCQRMTTVAAVLTARDVAVLAEAEGVPGRATAARASGGAR